MVAEIFVTVVFLRYVNVLGLSVISFYYLVTRMRCVLKY